MDNNCNLLHWRIINAKLLQTNDFTLHSLLKLPAKGREKFDVPMATAYFFFVTPRERFKQWVTFRIRFHVQKNVESRATSNRNGTKLVKRQIDTYEL